MGPLLSLLLIKSQVPQDLKTENDGSPSSFLFYINDANNMQCFWKAKIKWRKIRISFFAWTCARHFISSSRWNQACETKLERRFIWKEGFNKRERTENGGENEKTKQPPTYTCMEMPENEKKKMFTSSLCVSLNKSYHWEKELMLTSTMDSIQCLHPGQGLLGVFIWNR